MSACTGNWLVGDTVVLTATFKDAEGALADPADFSVFVREPDGTTTTYTTPDATITNPTVGVWKFTFVFDADGDWYFYIRGQGGTVGAAEQIKVPVKAPKMALV